MKIKKPVNVGLNSFHFSLNQVFWSFIFTGTYILINFQLICSEEGLNLETSALCIPYADDQTFQRRVDLKPCASAGH